MVARRRCCRSARRGGGQRGPRVQFVHLDLETWPGPAGWPRLGRLYRPFSDPALERMARVYVVSERGAHVLSEAHPRLGERIEFLPVWHGPAVFRAPARDERETARAGLAARLGLPGGGDDVKLVLLAGRIDDGKDPLLALGAIARLPAAVRLLIAGDGELRGAVESRIAELGLGSRVHLLGDVARDGLATLMRATDCLLLTSHSEGGGPRVVVEALASGLPVVATDVGEVRRTVSDGVNGRVVGAHEEQPLAEALAWTLAQPRDALAAAAAAAAAPYTAARSHENAAARLRPAADNRARSSPSASTRASWAVSALSSVGEKSSAASPQISGMAPASAASTGQPSCIASTSGMQKPS